MMRSQEILPVCVGFHLKELPGSIYFDSQIPLDNQIPLDSTIAEKGIITSE